MFSHHIRHKSLVEQTTHKLCIIKVHKGIKIENNNISVNPIKSFHNEPFSRVELNDLTQKITL